MRFRRRTFSGQRRTRWWLNPLFRSKASEKNRFPEKMSQNFFCSRYFLMGINDLFLYCQIYYIFLIDLVWLWPEKCWLLWRHRLLLQRTNWVIGLVVWAVTNGAKRPGFDPCSCWIFSLSLSVRWLVKNWKTLDPCKCTKIKTLARTAKVNLSLLSQ